VRSDISGRAMEVKVVRSPEEWRSLWERWKLHPAFRSTSLKLYVARLKHTKEQAHYCFMLIIGKPMSSFYQVWIFDKPTDFSGVGGRYLEEMNKWLEDEFLPLTKEWLPGAVLVRFEMPYEFYNVLDIVHYLMHSQEREGA